MQWIFNFKMICQLDVIIFKFHLFQEESKDVETLGQKSRGKIGIVWDRVELGRS